MTFDGDDDDDYFNYFAIVYISKQAFKIVTDCNEMLYRF